MRRNSRERNRSQFFIDRKGKVHKITGNTDDVISIHYNIANKLFPEIEYPKDPVDHVMKEGWILVGSTVYGHPIIHKKPTQAQIDKLFDLKRLDRLCFLWNGYYENYNQKGHLLD